VESYSELVFGRIQDASVTEYGQIARFREIRRHAVEWERSLPSFLNWTMPTNDRNPRSWVKMQRAYLESQYHCITMKISWSSASLDPVLMAKFQPFEGDENERYAEARVTAGRVLDIVKESAANSKTATLYHTAAVRATTLLLQILLQHGRLEIHGNIDEIVAKCEEGIALCRFLVPSVLTKAEDTIEALLTGHLARLKDGKLLPPTDESQQLVVANRPPAPLAEPPHNGFSAPFPFPYPFDNTAMDSLFQNNYHDPAFSPQFPDLQFGLFEGM